MSGSTQYITFINDKHTTINKWSVLPAGLLKQELIRTGTHKDEQSLIPEIQKILNVYWD